MDASDLVDTWLILNRIFVGDSPIARSQYYDTIKSSRMHIPEVKLWVDVLRLTMLEWMEYVNNPIPENYKLVRDVEDWAFRESLAISMISDSLFLAYQIDPEIFKRRFRAWIRKTKPTQKVPARPAFEWTEPLQSLELYSEFVGGPEDNK